MSATLHIYRVVDDVQELIFEHDEEFSQLGTEFLIGFKDSSGKEYIKQYIKDTYKYNLDRTCDEIRKVYTFNVTCQKTVPEAIISFLEGNSYEEVIRLAISLGGDADTIGAIAGSIAEAYYGIPDEFIKKCNKIIPKEMIKVINQFKEKIKEGN